MTRTDWTPLTRAEAIRGDRRAGGAPTRSRTDGSANSTITRKRVGSTVSNSASGPDWVCT